MAQGPLVSIVTPTYNHEAFIGHCIESVLSQTYENWEMLIVDDGSTDATVDIVNAVEDGRIRLFRQENQGLAALGATYNRALDATRGELVAILEGDDFWPREKLELQSADFADDAVVLSSGYTQVVDQAGNSMTRTPGHEPAEHARVNRPVGIAAMTMMDPSSLTYTFPVSTVLRADALKRIGGFVQPTYLPLVDFPTFLRMTIEGEFRFHNEVCGFWRRHEGSSTLSHRLSNILDGAYRCSFEFISQHRGRLPVEDADLDALEDQWQFFEKRLCMIRGRMFSDRKQFDKAVIAFQEGLRFRGSWRTDLALRISTALSRLHLPTEWLYLVMGHQHWAVLNSLMSGDSVVSEQDMDRSRPNYSWRAGLPQ